MAYSQAASSPTPSLEVINAQSSGTQAAMPTPIDCQSLTSLPCPTSTDGPLTEQDYYWDIVSQQNSASRSNLSRHQTSRESSLPGRDGSYVSNGLDNQDKLWFPDPTDAYANRVSEDRVSKFSTLAHALGTTAIETPEEPIAIGESVVIGTKRPVLGIRNINVSAQQARSGLPTVTDFSK